MEQLGEGQEWTDWTSRGHPAHQRLPHICDTDSMHQQIEKRAEKQISSSIYITNFVTTVMVMTGIMMSRMMGKLVKQEPPPSNAQSLVDPPPHQDSPCSQKR